MDKASTTMVDINQNWKDDDEEETDKNFQFLEFLWRPPIWNVRRKADLAEQMKSVSRFLG